MTTGWAQRRAASAPVYQTGGRPLTIGLVYNLSPSAFSSTWAQFKALLTAAAHGRTVELLVFTLREQNPDLHGHLPIDALPDHGVDALIVTGAEPTTKDLRSEWLWHGLTRLHDWAELQSVPVIWSCLAAHLAVLYRDGIARQRMTTKASGVFHCALAAPAHKLTAGMPEHWDWPHSRYNGIPEDALLAHGYVILSRTETVGVDVFARHGETLSLYFQGHPEYQADTLLREYLRDLRRHLAGESETYPLVPSGYLDHGTEGSLTALHGGQADDMMAGAQACAARAQFRHDWAPTAAKLYANWLDAIARTGSAEIRPWWPLAASPARAAQRGRGSL